jgi:hypothetical protein
MKTFDALVLSLGVLGLAACGGSGDSNPEPSDKGEPSTKAFAPPAPQEGFTRLEAPVVHGIEPGGDISYCQFVMAPVDHDIDILDMTGYQSTSGHHSLAYTTTQDVPVGTSRICTDEDDMQGGFLGGTGGEGTAVTLPDGVAFRLPKGSGIMLNTHFLNTTEETLDGYTVVDFEFAEVDPTRKIAAFFSNGTTTFDIPANGDATATAECVVQGDMDFIFFTAHLHEYGTFGETELVRQDESQPEIIYTGDWIPHYQVAPKWATWAVDSPLHVKKGDTLRSTCRWENSTAAGMTFPREMCFGIGFYVSDVPAAPTCMNGTYL